MRSRCRDILLIDDSGADRRFITHTLKRSATQLYQVDAASNAMAARDMLAKKSYDCLLVDYQLPDTDGLDLMKSICGTQAEGYPGLVMISGEGNENVAARAIQLGAHDYMTKQQINPNSLPRAIEAAIRRSEEKRSRLHQRLLMENFASSAAHDLANPLNGVIGFISLAQQMIEQERLDKVPGYLDNALTSAHYMRQLVTDLLHFARTGSAAETGTQVDLNETVSVAINVLDEAIQRSGATIKTDTLPSLQGYATELVQLFQNLIGNAIKYRSDTAPEVSVSAEDDGEYWLISIADNGCGIPEESRREIFSPLFRIHRKDTSGSGLGLAICTKIAELHKGKIWCDPGKNGGSIFRILLPKTQLGSTSREDLIHT